MPTYEYRCKDCGEHLEVVQSFTEDPLADCPACGGSLRKVFGNIGIVFKGSGFYKTDSRGSTAASKSGEAAGAAKEAAAGGSSGQTPSSGGTSEKATPADAGTSSGKPAASGSGASSSTPAAAAS